MIHMLNGLEKYMNFIDSLVFVDSIQFTNYSLQTFTKYLSLTLVFMQNSALLEKFNSVLKEFLLVLTKFSFLQRD